jgi:hypothetical protein
MRKKKFAQGGTALSLQALEEEKSWPTPTSTERAGPNGQVELGNTVRKWPTPTASGNTNRTDRKHTTKQRVKQHSKKIRYPVYPPGPKETDRWTHMLSIVPKAQPTFCRVVDGAMSGVDIRLRAIGNGVVPSVAAIAFRTLAKNLGLNL